MQYRFWFPLLCKLSLVKLLFRRCFDRKTQNEICQVGDSAIGERGACKNEIAHLQELQRIRKGEGKHGLLKKDHDRLDYCRIELVELKHRHQLAMQRYKEIATPIRYSFASDSNLKKIRRDRMEIMRAYTITKSRDDLQYHA